MCVNNTIQSYFHSYVDMRCASISRFQFKDFTNAMVEMFRYVVIVVIVVAVVMVGRLWVQSVYFPSKINSKVNICCDCCYKTNSCNE